MLFDFLEETRNLSVQESAVWYMSQEQLAQAIKVQAAYWKQRGKRKALREGDSNTKFFHAHATQRLRRNAIKLVEVDGVQLTAHEGKVTALTNYFKHVLGTPEPAPSALTSRPSTKVVIRRVTDLKLHSLNLKRCRRFMQ